MSLRLSGTWVPLLTPLDDDGAVDLAAVGPCVERVVAAGADGLVAMGTTGEWSDLTDAERDELVREVVVTAGGRVTVLAGAGAPGTTGARERAVAAAGAGAAGVLVLPPLYWKLDADGLVRHVADVAAAVDVPVVCYDFPTLAGTALTPAIVARIAEEVPRVAGIKLSGPELRTARGVRRLAGPDLAVLIGSADLVVPAIASGAADGTIAAIANVVPEVVVATVAAALDGDDAAAARGHRQVLAALEVTGLCSPPILALKAAAAERGAPLRPVVRTRPASPLGDPAAISAAARELARTL